MPRSGKTGSKAERDALRQEMLVRGCSLGLIAAEMERRWGFRPREAYRHAHGWSQDEVAARFTEVAERLGGDRERVADRRPAAATPPMIGTRIGEYERWPHGGRRPSPYVLTVLAAVLGTTIDQLLDYADHRHMPDQERTVLAAVLAASTPPVPPTAGGAPLRPPPAGGLPAPDPVPATGPKSVRAVPAMPGAPVTEAGSPTSSGAPARRTTSDARNGAGPDPSSRGATSRSADPAPRIRPVPATAAQRQPRRGEAAPREPVPVPGVAVPGMPVPGVPVPGVPASGEPTAREALSAEAAEATEAAEAADAAEQPRLPQRVPQPVPPPLPDAAVIAVALDPAAPEAASAARRHRRDRLLAGLPDNLPSEEEVIMDAAGQSAEFGEWAEATNVGPTTLEQLDEDVRRIARGYLNNAPMPLMLTALRVRNRVFTLLEGRQHPDQTRQLYLTAGRLCGLLAWMAGDVGRHGEAETQARTGWLCAELASADGLRAWVRATQSKVAYWDGRVRESARLAEDGLRYSASDTARVLLASLAGRAWARLGDADSAHASLNRAVDEREKAGEDEVGGLFGFSEAQQSYLAGTTHLWLREPEAALRAADRAVWLYQVGDPAERFYGAEMLALIDAATAHLQAEEIDGAAEKLRPVLELPGEQRLVTFTQRLGEMRDVLRRSRHATSRPAVDIQRQIEDFRAGALGQYMSR